MIAGEVRCVGSDMFTPINTLRFIDGEWVMIDNFSASMKIAVKIPDNAYYLQFTCKFNEIECGYDETQVEIGDTYVMSGDNQYVKDAL